MADPVISDRIKDSYVDRMSGTMHALVCHSVNKRNLDIVSVSKKKRKPQKTEDCPIHNGSLLIHHHGWFTVHPCHNMVYSLILESKGHL